MDYFKLVFILVLLLVQFHNAFAAPTSTIPVNSTVKTPISRSSNSTRGNNTAMAAPVVLGNITRNSTMATSVRSSNTTRSNNTAMDDPVALGNTTQNSTMATSIGFPNTTRGNNSTALTAPVVLESTNQNSTMPMPIAGSSNNRKRYNTTTVAVHVVVGSVTQNFTTPGVTSEFVINNTTMSSAKGFSRNRKSKCTKSATGKLSNVQNSTSTTFTTMVANVSQNATGLPRTENIGSAVFDFFEAIIKFIKCLIHSTCDATRGSKNRTYSHDEDSTSTQHGWRHVVAFLAAMVLIILLVACCYLLSCCGRNPRKRSNNRRAPPILRKSAVSDSSNNKSMKQVRFSTRL